MGGGGGGGGGGGVEWPSACPKTSATSPPFQHVVAFTDRE